MSRLLLSAALGLSCLAPACALAQQASHPLTLEQIMADPDWIGPPVEDAWWRWDGRAVQYTLKRDGAGIRDTWQQDTGGAAAALVDGAARAQLDASGPVYDAQRARMAFIRNGDVFVRDLRSGKLEQLTRTDADESSPQWASDGGALRASRLWLRKS